MSGSDGLIITNHAADRFKERCGLPRRVVTKATIRALDRGITRDETTGALRRYFDHLYDLQKTADNIRIYGGKVYIFHRTTLITILNLPNEYRKTTEKIQRKKAQP